MFTFKGKLFKMKTMDAIDTLLTRGVEQIYPTKEALENVLRSGKKIKLYLGVDPSGTQLHIGHAVALRKLKQFQDLGHHVILLIGDFTGMIGDPSGKSSARKRLTRSQVLENARDYQKQAQKIIRFDGQNPIELKFNSQWLSRLNFEEILNLASLFTVQQMLERDMFVKRIKEAKPIGLHEFLYPLMQGYDSVALEVDLEIGGTDQTFNMLAGRTLMKALKDREKFVLTVPLLSDAKGIKIGKTEGNVIGLTDPPDEFFGKIMNLGDSAIIPCFTLLTDTPLEEIAKMKQAMTQGTNPMTFKKQLAFELTKQFNNEMAAESARMNFENLFQKRETSAVAEAVMINNLPQNPINIIDLLLAIQTKLSKSAARRLIEQGAVEIDQTVVDMVKTNVTLQSGMTMRIGKKRFIKFI